MRFIDKLLYPYRLRARAARQRKLDDIVIRAVKSVRQEVEDRAPAIFKDTFYGATGIDPRHLVIWYIFKTDADLQIAQVTGLRDLLDKRTREALAARDYPPEAVPRIMIPFTSDEDVQKKTGGNYFLYFK